MADPSEKSTASGDADATDRDADPTAAFETPPGAPPATPREPVVDERHGDRVDDPYRWLEADDDDRVTAWVDAQNAHTDALVDTDTRERLRPRYEALADVAAYHVPTARGDRYFQRVRAAGADRAALYTWTGAPDGDRGDPLVDPNAWTDAAAMNWYVPSPDGGLLAYGYDEGGEEQYDVRVIDVEGRRVATVVDAGRVSPQSFAWTGDGSGFYYVTTGGAGDGAQLEKTVRYHALEAAAPSDPVTVDPTTDPVVATDFAPAVWPALEYDDVTGRLVLTYSEMSADDEVYVTDGTSPTDDAAAVALEPALTGHGATFDVTVHDGTAYLRTDLDAPRRRVLTCPVAELASRPIDAFAEPVPESEAVVQGLAVAGDRLVVSRLRDACSELLVVDPDGTTRELAVPAFSTVAELTTGEPAAATVFYRIEGFDRPAGPAVGDATAGETRVLDRPDVAVPELTVERRWVTSTDDAAVPVFVVRRADHPLDDEAGGQDAVAPTVLYGYGGFRIPQPPQFDRFRVPFLEAGGVYAQVCARGGFEFGEPWHRAGMREHKQHTFDDFIAAAELLATEYTSPDRLAVTGGSNGGLSVGAAITQRPDLFGAAVAAVPLLDMLRFDRFLLGEAWTVEYGSPADPDDYAVLKAYSPYHNLKATDSPATYVETAAGDTRVHPAHARKFVARLQALSPDAPVCLRTKTDTGHGVGKPASMVAAEALDRWTFLFDRLGGATLDAIGD